ncbi:hypothetical protein ACQJBY_061479 [Aegilops geniculata]
MSSTSSKPKRAGGLQGARPQPLSLPSKKPCVGGHAGPAGPVIVYERTPRVVHADPHDFMAVVQKLTGKQRSPEAASGARDGRASTSTAADALVLTLGQEQRRAPCRHDHPAPCASPGTASSISPLSPSSFFLSPATMQAIRDLIS